MDGHTLVDAAVTRAPFAATNRLIMAWLDLPLRTKGLIVLAIPLLAVIGGFVLAFSLDRHEDQVRDEVLDAEEISDALGEIQHLVIDAEAGVWGYLLSGQTELLTPTDAAVTELPQALAQLEGLIQDPAQQARARDLRLVVERRMAVLATTRSYGEAGGSAPFAVPGAQLVAGNAAMKAVRKQITAMQAAEGKMLEARIEYLDRTQERSFAFLIGIFVIGLGGGVVIALLLAKGVVDRIQQLETSAKRLASGDPVLVTPPGNDEVGRLGQSLTDASQLLIAREEELRSTNRELEAFSYSISHDLRAPLRAVDGFSRLLLDDHAAAIPAEAQRYLHLVRDRAQQMGQLIDDLLAFSRLNRTPLAARPIAPASIVQRVLNDYADEREGRDVEIAVDDLPPCQADPALLTQVFANLLANSLKYTRGRNPARIEVGALPDPDAAGKHVYFVRDNGVGFDMAYADKLFGVFQRLHRAEEYEGTGVGLAIVQRVIHRHGGRIWAEATVDEGATFLFTLPAAHIGATASPAVQPTGSVLSPERAAYG